MSGYEITGTSVTHQGVLGTVEVSRLRLPDGKVVEREVVRHAGAVAVVAIRPDGKVVLVRQYRVALDAHVLELPAGKLDVAGEDAEAAARRELEEEAGLVAGRLTQLTTFHNSVGWTDEATVVYLAADATPSQSTNFTPEAEEADMEVVEQPLAQAVDRVHSGDISDAKTVIGLLLAWQRLGRISA